MNNIYGGPEKSLSGRKPTLSLYYGTETFIYQSYGKKEKNNREIQVNNPTFGL